MSAQPAAQADRCFSLAECRAHFFPGRCLRWIRDEFKAGKYGAVFFDGRWMISESAVRAWQEKHRVCADQEPQQVRPVMISNLKRGSFRPAPADSFAS